MHRSVYETESIETKLTTQIRWLFDRMVESPHKTSFYARETDGYGDDRNWQEAAQYWYTYIIALLLSLHILLYDQVQWQTHGST